MQAVAAQGLSFSKVMAFGFNPGTSLKAKESPHGVLCPLICAMFVSTPEPDSHKGTQREQPLPRGYFGGGTGRGWQLGQGAGVAMRCRSPPAQLVPAS